MKILSRALLFVSFISLPLISFAKKGTVLINEICWMGTAVSPNQEWIELYNTTEEQIILDGWILEAKDGIPKIKLKGKIPPYGFYLLERINDNTLPEIAADLIYKGGLENKGEYLQLFDNQNNLIDEVNCSSGWFAGNKETKQTMERKIIGSGSDSKSWQTSRIPGGTPKAKNSKNTNQQNQKQAKKTLGGILFNEILPSPKGSDAQEEWIEIFNQNTFEVDLSGWLIKDEKGRTKTFKIPEGTKIPPQGYLVFKRPETKIVLNNKGDILNLFQPNNIKIDQVSYTRAKTGQSYSRIQDKWVWTEILTPGKKNAIREEKENLSEIIKKQTASISSKTQKPRSFVFLWGIIVALFSATTIFFLKKLTKSL